MMKYSEKEIDDLLKKIWAGTISIEDLPVSLYKAISKYLISGLDVIKETVSPKLLTELEDNLKYFSGAKVYHQINEISLVKDSEQIKTFPEFKNEALAIYDKYNQDWLKTEYNTTIAQSQMIERWEQIESQKERLPFLKYSAVIDNNTSEICLPLDGITMPVGDSFWDTNSPLNHFNCFVEKTFVNCGDYETTIDSLRVGQKVLTNKIRLKEIEKIHKTQYNGDVYRFLISAGVFFRCTPNHPILTSDGWKIAGEITKEDYLISISGGLKKPKKIIKEKYEGTIYNLTVKDDETYILGINEGGVIVHNCRCTLEQVDEFDAKVTPKEKADEISKEMNQARQPLFNSNPYRDKEIFSKEHPYFDLDKKGAEAVVKLVEDGE